MAVLSPLKSQNGFGVTPVRELLITASTGERLASSFSPEVVLRQQELCGANPDSFTIGKNIYQNSKLTGYIHGNLLV